MNYFKLLEQYSKATNLPVSIFENGNLIFKGHNDKQDYNLPMFLMECLPSELPDIWVSRTPENLFFGGLSFRKQKQILLIGPVSVYECSISQCKRILQRMGRRTQDTGAFQMAINSFASCDIFHLRNHLRFLNHLLNEEEDVEISKIDFRWKSILFYTEEHFTEIPAKAENDVEEDLITYIKNGKVEELEDYFNEVFFRTDNPMEKDSHNINLRRTFIFGANIFISRIAIQLGIDVQEGRNLADYYLNLLTEADNLTDLNYIFYKMTLEYTKKIRDVQAFVSENMLARSINRFVQAHLYEKLSAAVIAEALHFNEAYLCEEFKRSTGQTVTQFIQECKIHEARFLLEKGHFPAEISDMLEFSSPSYFGMVFKKITGMTPMQYRKSLE